MEQMQICLPCKFGLGYLLAMNDIISLIKYDELAVG